MCDGGVVVCVSLEQSGFNRLEYPCHDAILVHMRHACLGPYSLACIIPYWD